MLKSLAIKELFSRTWEQVGERIVRGVGYWNDQLYPYVWTRRRRHRPVRRLSIKTMPTVPTMIGWKCTDLIGQAECHRHPVYCQHDGRTVCSSTTSAAA